MFEAIRDTCLRKIIMFGILIFGVCIFSKIPNVIVDMDWPRVNIGMETFFVQAKLSKAR